MNGYLPQPYLFANLRKWYIMSLVFKKRDICLVSFFFLSTLLPVDKVWSPVVLQDLYSLKMGLSRSLPEGEPLYVMVYCLLLFYWRLFCWIVLWVLILDFFLIPFSVQSLSGVVSVFRLIRLMKKMSFLFVMPVKDNDGHASYLLMFLSVTRVRYLLSSMFVAEDHKLKCFLGFS